MPFSSIKNFLNLESASGAILLLSAILSLVLNNLPFLHFETLLQQTLFSRSILFWINEGLMSLFFLVVGLELKREFLQGELAGASRLILPGGAALGGMIVPALIFVFINRNHPEFLKGCTIPIATDVAFALGVLSLFGKRIHLGIKLFLLALAIFDDLGAIIVIAILYTAQLSYFVLLPMIAIFCLLYLLNRFRVQCLIAYLFLGVLLWFCLLFAGIHATLSGALLALFVPLRHCQNHFSPAEKLENSLHRWVAYIIMPLFALANAGVPLHGMHIHSIFNYLSLGIMLGLFLGKQIGVFSVTWLLVQFRWAKLPRHTQWKHIYSIAVLCGIGFTMSLFLGTLAFEHAGHVYLNEVRLGVLIGSTLSGVMGALLLHYTLKNRRKR